MQKKDLSIATYQELCDLAVLIEVPNMLKQQDYISYTTRYGGYEFLFAFGKYLLEVQSSNLINSPYYSLMLDESIDNGLDVSKDIPELILVEKIANKVYA